MTATDNDGKQANQSGKQNTSTETNDFEAIPSVSQHVLTQESLVGALSTPIQSAVHHTLAPVLEVPGDMYVGKNE